MPHDLPCFVVPQLLQLRCALQELVRSGRPGCSLLGLGSTETFPITSFAEMEAGCYQPFSEFQCEGKSLDSLALPALPKSRVLFFVSFLLEAEQLVRTMLFK